MPPHRPSKRRVVEGFACCAALAACGSGLALATPAPAAGPSLVTDHPCYEVGTTVQLTGSGFARSEAFVVSIDGVYFGQSTTDGSGGFTSALSPGGLGSGVAQAVDQVEASDGTLSADATFTLTRAPGARFVASSAHQTKVPLEVWGYSFTGQRRTVYVHYVSPSGQPARTVRAGRTGGQCGFLETAPHAIFPFTPSSGRWTLQVDTHRRYARRPAGPVSRIRVRIG